MSDDKPIFSITDKDIEINLTKDTSFATNSDKTFMQGVKQNVQGGQLEHKAEKELIQVGNTMKETEGGKILNEVANGSLKQTDNLMEVDGESTIINKINPDPSASI